MVSLAAPSRRDDQIELENRDDDNFEQAYGNDFETNRRYLAFSWWLLHRGSKDIMEKIREAVIAIFGPLNPREEITMERLSELTLELRKKVEGATDEDRKYILGTLLDMYLQANLFRSTKWLTYLLPPLSSESIVLQESGIVSLPSPPLPTASDTVPTSDLSADISPTLRRLLDETSDLIDSPTFTHVLTLLLDTSFSLLVDSKIATQAFKLSHSSTSPSTSSPTPRIQELDPTSSTFSALPTQAKAKVANLLAVFAKQAHAIGAGDGDGDADPDSTNLDPAAVAAAGPAVNDYLAAMDAVRDLHAFAAVVYSSNFEAEAAEIGDGETTPADEESKRVSSVWDSNRVSAAFEAEGEGAGEVGGWEGAWMRAMARDGER